MKLKRIFLKRTVLEDINLDNFFIGSVLMIFSRQLKIVAYVD
jgi:hypothetical protein